MISTTLLILPSVMLLLLLAVATRIVRSPSFPFLTEMLVFVLLIAVRSVVFLCGMWETTRILTDITPFFLFLAAEESVRTSVYLVAKRSRAWGKYFWSLGVGLLCFGVSVLVGNTLYPIRCGIQAGVAAGLGACLLHSGIMRWWVCHDAPSLVRQVLLLLWALASLVSSMQPAESNWWSATLLTECTQIGILAGLYVSIPRRDKCLSTIASIRSS